ncbi:hypothetical protein [Asaia lannensis]|uniref:hypothetical protein n=1 Tax=Asaia lannensis TaxID=415421 RepID=UPI003872C502
MTEAELEDRLARIEGDIIAHGTIIAAITAAVPEPFRSNAFALAQTQMKGVDNLTREPTTLRYEVAREEVLIEFERVKRISEHFTSAIGPKSKSP